MTADAARGRLAHHAGRRRRRHASSAKTIVPEGGRLDGHDRGTAGRRRHVVARRPIRRPALAAPTRRATRAPRSTRTVRVSTTLGFVTTSKAAVLPAGRRPVRARGPRSASGCPARRPSPGRSGTRAGTVVDDPARRAADRGRHVDAHLRRPKRTDGTRCRSARTRRSSPRPMTLTTTSQAVAFEMNAFGDHGRRTTTPDARPEDHRLRRPRPRPQKAAPRCTSSSRARPPGAWR